MSDEFKCGVCKEVFSQFLKFIEHKGQCSPVVSGTTPTMTILTIPPLTVLTQFNNHYQNVNTAKITPPILHDQVQNQHQHQQQQQQLQPQPQQLLVVPQHSPSNYNGIMNECTSTFVPWISQIPPTSTSASSSSTSPFVQDVKSDIINQLIYTESPTIQNNPQFIQNTEFNYSPLSSESQQMPILMDCRTIATSQHIENGIDKKSINKKIRNKKKKIDSNLLATTETETETATPTSTNIKVKRIRTRKKASELNRTYQCKICGRSFRLNKIKDHMQIHMVWPDTLEANIGTGNFDESEGNYRCNHCPERIATFKKLRTHMHTLHKNVKLYMCPMSECRQLFGFEDLIIEHSKWCAFKSNVQCPICYQYFSLIRELEIHLIEHRDEIVKNMATGLPVMAIADEQSKQTSAASIIESKIPFDLSTALLQNTSVIPINTNIKTESNIIIKTEQSELILPQPAPSTNYNSGQSTGTDAHHLHQLHPNQCPVCLVKYKSHASMLKHLHKDTHSHECQMCPKVFMNKRALTMHLHIHRDLRCICQICNRSFKMPKMLKAHLLTHIERGYICDICGIVTSLKYNLIKHFRRHSNPMLMCSVNGCKRVFRRTDCLKAHRKTHKTKRCKRKANINSISCSGNDETNDDNQTNGGNTINNNLNNELKLNKAQPAQPQILRHFKRPINFKKNVVIPGIVIKGDQITEGYDILQKYKKNTAKNNIQQENDYKTDQTKLEFSDDCCLTTNDNNENNNLKKNINDKEINSSKTDNNNNNDNNNLIDICSNGKKFEFVECNSFHNNYTVSVAIEKLPEHITNYYMKKMGTFEGDSEPEFIEEITIFEPLISSMPIVQKSRPVQSEFVDVSRRRPKGKQHIKMNNGNTIEIPMASNSLESELDECENDDGDDDDDDGNGDGGGDGDDDNANTKPVKKRQYIMKNRKKKEIIPKKIQREKLKEPNKKLPAALSAWPTKRLHLFVIRLTKKTKTTAKTFECKICGRHFKANSVHNHLQSHCVWPFTKNTHIGNSTFDTAEKIYRCPYCPETFVVHAPLRSHMAQTHFNEKVFICPLGKCRRLFNVDLEFLQHCAECVFQSTLRCPICHRFFSNTNELKTHKTIVHEIVDNSDDDNTNNNNNNGNGNHSNIDKNNPDDNQGVNKHVMELIHQPLLCDDSKMKTIKALKRYECNVCHTKFKNKILLAKHITRDSHDHQCIYCGKKFLRLTCVQNHILSHREAPKMCYICGKLFKTRTSLHLHMIGHTKCFTCDICEKMFARKKELIKHIKSHNEPLYGCTHPGCKVVYRRKELILRHLKKNEAHHITLVKDNVF